MAKVEYPCRTEQPSMFRFILAGITTLIMMAAHLAAAEEIRIGGTGSALGTMQLLAKSYSAKYPDISVKFFPSLGSSGGIRAVAGGALDVALSSRRLREDEFKQGLTEIEYGRTPFVIAVGGNTPIKEITKSQLIAIYSGEQTHWPDGKPIRLVLRPPSDTDAEMLKAFSPEVRQAVQIAEKRPGVSVANTDQEAADDLERIPGAFGPTSLAVILSERRNLRPLIIEGQKPSVVNVAEGKYAYFKKFFAIYPAKPRALVVNFIAFIQSPEGRAILAENGHSFP